MKEKIEKKPLLDIEKKLDLYNNERLCQIVTVNAGDYEPEAVDIAKKLLKNRGVDYNSVYTAAKDNTTDQSNNESDSIPVYFEMSDSSGGYETIDLYRSEFKKSRESKCIIVNPWSRRFARTIDLGLWNLFLREIIHLLAGDAYEEISTFAGGYAIFATGYVLWIFIEAFALSRYGYTLGKWLLNVHVRNDDGTNPTFTTAIKRGFIIWFIGEGISISFLGFVTNIISFFYLSNKETTIWDKKLNLKVKHTPISWVRILIAAILILAPVCLLLMQYKM